MISILLYSNYSSNEKYTNKSSDEISD